jgi:hypothetical protein
MDGQLEAIVIRQLTIDDLPWGLSLAWRRYDHFDPGAASVFYINALKLQATTGLLIRTNNAFLIAHINNLPWQPTERQAHVLILCADEGRHWEAVRLLRQSLYWAREQKCKCWWFTSDTKHDVTPLCVRVGATSRVPRYWRGF